MRIYRFRCVGSVLRRLRVNLHSARLLAELSTRMQWLRIELNMVLRYVELISREWYNATTVQYDSLSTQSIKKTLRSFRVVET